MSELNLLSRSVSRVSSCCAANLNVEAHSAYSTINRTTTTQTPTTTYSSPPTTTPPPLLLPFTSQLLPLPPVPEFCSVIPLLTVEIEVVTMELLVVKMVGVDEL